MRILASLLLVLVALSSADAGPPRHRGYRWNPGGAIESLAMHDVNMDGRKDVVMLVRTKNALHPTLVWIAMPEAPTKGSYISSEAVTRIPCDNDLADAGVVAVGTFRSKDTTHFRFMGPSGIVDVERDGKRHPKRANDDNALVYGRSPSGRLRLLPTDAAGVAIPHAATATMRHTKGDRKRGGDGRAIPIRGRNIASPRGGISTELNVPRPWLLNVNAPGKGALEGLFFFDADTHTLTATHRLNGSLSSAKAVSFPFMTQPTDLKPVELHTARVQFADVNGDGTSDALVTLLTGRRDILGSLRTILFHYDGKEFKPSKDAAKPLIPGSSKCRIDTESVALHPRFVDINGDGALDYVCDSIRGKKTDLFLQMMGRNPPITFTGFLFDPAKGTFSNVPYFTLQRTYALSQAMSNEFGQSAWFDGDFDGDGHGDMLDLGDLKGVEVWRGAKAEAGARGDPVVFKEALVARIAVTEGLEPFAGISDLNKDGRDDAVLHSKETLYFLISEGEAK